MSGLVGLMGIDRMESAFIDSLIHSFIHSITDSFTPPIQSLIHSTTPLVFLSNNFP